MMKACPQDAFDGFANAKCGEIFCQSSTSFSIICTFCEMKSFKFSEFLLHFKNVHFDNELLNTNELNMSTAAAAAAAEAPAPECILLKQECSDEHQQSSKMMTTTRSTNVFGTHDDDNNDWFNSNGDDDDDDDSDGVNSSYENNIKSHDHVDDDTIDAGSLNINMAVLHNDLPPLNDNDNILMDINCSKRIINWSAETTTTTTAAAAPPTKAKTTIAQQQQQQPPPAMSTRLKRDRQCNLKKNNKEIVKHGINSDKEYADNVEEDQISDKDDKPYKPIKSPPPKQYKCDFCDKIYVTKGSQVQHMRREHDLSLITTCTECKTDLPSQRQHDQHVIQQHGGFLCEQCAKRYKCRRDLQRHEVKHTGIRSIVCDFEGCDKRFFTTRNMQSHRKIHTLEKNFVCENCGYSCRTKYTLRVHLRMHTGEKPFACKVCPKRFPSHSGLREHITMHSSARPHVCKICNASFARQKALYHHKFLHFETKKFVCKICGNAYAQQSGLAGHVRKHKEGVF